MSRETLQESLSAVMDNEADELELRRVLAASENGELRGTWSRYQVARAAMHRELLVPQLDIASAVSAALAEEAAPARKTPMWRSVGRVAVAASVTVAVLAGVRLYNQDDLSGAQLAQQSAAPAISVPQVQGPALLAGYNSSEEVSEAAEPGTASWHEQRLPTYLRQHAQQAVMGAGETALPYARAASLENR
ncbi:RseA family anti-sigma factor [Pseudomonas berkeleyensis]|uniref:RNA polymerase subunit sigma n=1 Tax=Pseudomonas berkeleyensis TaxID=2726956 RepID=A0A7G5DJR7_9PSED|nr:RseA family anti-sigma factor [Pseudomonas berkeleyensis]QMV61992.1 RNA polymerase subunit sigma [Pseudomonas berkeleyensis]WSO37434.1 RseA family anti-sigma factor [Pseudomonas berkeleyensis]